MLQHVAQTRKVAESVAEWCGAGLGHVTYGICWRNLNALHKKRHHVSAAKLRSFGPPVRTIYHIPLFFYPMVRTT